MSVENMTIVAATSIRITLGEKNKDDRKRGDTGCIAESQPEAPTASDIAHLIRRCDSNKYR